jgi:hypothetical protein
VATAAAFGGQTCSGSDAETQDCEDAPCPVDCVLGDWENKGDCTATCGGGEQSQTRSITVESDHGGADCDAERSQTVTCGTDPCPVDCSLTDWVEDGSCSKSCGEGAQNFIKGVETAAANGGEACPDAEDASRKKTEACNSDPCPVDCVLTAFGAWGDCSVTCGDGTRSKTRSVETEAANGGAECTGELSVEETCHAGHCPVDCAVSEWGDWAACTVTCGETGSQERSRVVNTDTEHGGAACDALAETRDTCPGLTACPVDCVLSDWGAYGDCSATCGEGTKTKGREVLTPAANNGAACGTTEQSVPCGIAYCAVDCVMTDWTASGTCSVVCGGGVQTYTRRVDVQPEGDGAACETEVTKTEACNEHACPWAPVGESGAMVVGLATESLTFNFEFKTSPVVITGVGSKVAFIGAASRGGGRGFTEKASTAGEVRSSKLDLVEKSSKPSRAAQLHEKLLKSKKRILNQRGHAEAEAQNQMDATLQGKGWHAPPPPVPEPTPHPTPAPTHAPTEAPTPFPTPVPSPNYYYHYTYEAEDPASPVTGTYDEVDLSVTPVGKLEHCKCTGGPSNAIQFGDGNTQYPTEYGKFCAPWSPRDPSAAEAQVGGDPELVYLGDLWAYNTVTKMRVYLGMQVSASEQTIGENVVLPAGVEIPDFPAEDGVEWPSLLVGSWCYTASGCTGAKSDGWATWQYCNEGAWDDRPPTQYPDDPAACPVGGYGGPKITLTKLSRKSNTMVSDICIGANGFNDCHDSSGATGGTIIGFVSNMMLTSQMVLLRSAYSETSSDTCLFPDGEMEKYCKGESYGDPTDLGWVFKNERPGTEKLEGLWNPDYATSCARVETGDQSCFGDAAEVVGVIGYLPKVSAESAWEECGFGSADSAPQWAVQLEVRDGGDAASLVSTKGSVAKKNLGAKVPWMAFQEGVYTTADGSMMQAGIAKVLAGSVEEVTTVPFHQAFSSAPAVIAQVSGGAEVILRQRDPSTEECYFLLSDTEGLGASDVIEVHWMAFTKTETGYFGSVPFVAGELDGSDSAGDAVTWPEGAFSQIPLVFASAATDRTPGGISVLLTDSTPDGAIFKQEGSETLEKISYFAYNGKGTSGAVMNAVMDLEMRYNMAYTAWEGSCPGTATREAKCMGVNGVEYPTIYCGKSVDTSTSRDC